MNIDNTCFICCEDNKLSKNELIKIFCKCNMHIHIKCLVNMIKHTKKSYCSVCLDSFGAYLDFRKRIIFPFENIYYIPLLTEQIIRIDSKDYIKSFQYAIINRIDERIEQLLNSITDDDFILFKKSLNNTNIQYDIIWKNSDDKICVYLDGFKSYFSTDEKVYQNYLENLFYQREIKLFFQKPI